MNPALRTTLLLAALVLGVVVAAVFYGRMVRVPETTGPSPAAGPSASEEADPRFVDPTVSAGLESARDGRFEEARRRLESVDASNPGYLLALRGLASVYTALEEPDGAVRVLLELSRLNPDDPDTLIRLAWAFQAADSPDQAELTALRLLEIQPGNLDARYDIAFFRIEQDRIEQAMRSYYRAVQQYPDQARFSGAKLRLVER